MNRSILVFAAAVMLLIGRSLCAEEVGISVSGSGEAKSRPNQVEISAIIAGEAELANDAIVKYRDAKKRAIAAMEALKNPNLKIESGGYSIQQAIDPNQQQMMMQGRMAAAVKPKVQVAETLKIILKDADKNEGDSLMDVVLKIIDTGRDGGLQIGPTNPQNYYQMQIMMQNGQGGQTMCVFKIADPSAQREKAYKAAMDDAKAKAQRLADLAGVKLGRIVSVQDAGQSHTENPQIAYMIANGMMAPTDTNELVSSLFTEISMRVSLSVHFEIAK